MSSFVSAAAMALLGPSSGRRRWVRCSWARRSRRSPGCWLDRRHEPAASSLAGRAPWRSPVVCSRRVMAPFVLQHGCPRFVHALHCGGSRQRCSSRRPSGCRPARRAGAAIVALGGPWARALLGLAYLARQEVVWLGLVVLAHAGSRVRALRHAARRLPRQRRGASWPIVVGGLLVVVPWLVRNTVDLGTPFPGQTLENPFLRRNEDIFAFAERPSAAAYLGQDVGHAPGQSRRGRLGRHGRRPAPAGIPDRRRGPRLIAGPAPVAGPAAPTALQALLLSGGLTFLATVLLFPVATRWGTYLHASGPLLVALTAVSALGADALLARISRWRGWPKANVVIGPRRSCSSSSPWASCSWTCWLTRHGTTGAASRPSRETWPRPPRREAPHGSSSPTIPCGWRRHRGASRRPARRGSCLAPGARRALRHAPGSSSIDERGRYPDALLGEPGSDCLAAAPEALGETAGLRRGSSGFGDVQRMRRAAGSVTGQRLYSEPHGVRGAARLAASDRAAGGRGRPRVVSACAHVTPTDACRCLRLELRPREMSDA